MATPSSSAHQLEVDLGRESNESDRLLPAQEGRPSCQYFGDDAPTLRLLLPTAPVPTQAIGSDAIPTTPMARLRLRRVVKRVPSDD